MTAIEDAVPDREPHCTHCGSRELELGYIQVPGTSANGMIHWLSGDSEPRPSGGARKRGRKRGVIVAYCCEVCEHLDFFVVPA